jgi:class 3 adenylate cyclase
MQRKHIRQHWRGFDKKQVAIALVLVILASVAHYFALRSENGVVSALGVRLHFIPVLYAAIFGGMYFGGMIGLLTAVIHFLVMDNAMPHNTHNHHLQAEHYIETIFLIAIGFLTGAFRDHEKHEKEQKHEISEHFGSYVSNDVRDDILSGNVNLGGDEVEVTILFADIRNFTALSERHTPAEIVAMLNQYFTEMVKAITNHGGMVNKFIGDAIMAIFGAPRKLENHAESGVHAAQEMLDRLKAHNFLQTAKGECTFEIGIGINTGKVIAGNIGAESRKEYTVIGDAVNLASRIEGLTKSYGTAILIADSVQQQLDTQKISLRELDKVTVKGKQKPCTIFEVVSGK